MSILINILAVIAIAVIIIIAATVIYRAVYKNRINQHLNSENIHPRKMLSPWAFLTLSVIVVLIVFAGFATYLALNPGGEKVPEEYIRAVYDYKSFDPNEMTDYRSLYSIDENPGYTKQIEQKGDIRFTYFTSNDEFDYYHPEFIVFVEYTGDKNILYYGVEGNFSMPKGLHMAGSGHAGADFNDYICAIGTSTVECKFELTAYLYDSELKGQEMSDYAVANETLTIWIPSP